MMDNKQYRELLELYLRRIGRIPQMGDDYRKEVEEQIKNDRFLQQIDKENLIDIIADINSGVEEWWEQPPYKSILKKIKKLKLADIGKLLINISRAGMSMSRQMVAGRTPAPPNMRLPNLQNYLSMYSPDVQSAVFSGDAVTLTFVNGKWSVYHHDALIHAGSSFREEREVARDYAKKNKKILVIFDKNGFMRGVEDYR